MKLFRRDSNARFMLSIYCINPCINDPRAVAQHMLYNYSHCLFHAGKRWTREVMKRQKVHLHRCCVTRAAKDILLTGCIPMCVHLSSSHPGYICVKHFTTTTQKSPFTYTITYITLCSLRRCFSFLFEGVGVVVRSCEGRGFYANNIICVCS